MPEEIHVHEGPEGNVVGRTRILRESPWDDQQRALAEALILADDLICPKCGNPREICSDPARPWFPQRSTCYATATKEAVERALQEREHGKPSVPELQDADGRHIWASLYDLSPDDDFL